MWLVMMIEETINVEGFGLKQEIPLIVADGMIGMMPVFDKQGDAEKYSEGKYVIHEIERVGGYGKHS